MRTDRLFNVSSSSVTVVATSTVSVTTVSSTSTLAVETNGAVTVGTLTGESVVLARSCTSLTITTMSQSLVYACSTCPVTVQHKDAQSTVNTLPASACTAGFTPGSGCYISPGNFSAGSGSGSGTGTGSGSGSTGCGSGTPPTVSGANGCTVGTAGSDTTVAVVSGGGSVNIVGAVVQIATGVTGGRWVARVLLAVIVCFGNVGRITQITVCGLMIGVTMLLRVSLCGTCQCRQHCGFK